MASNVKGPAIFLAQFAGDAAPFNTFGSICKWAASLGYKGVQIPTWDGRLFDLAKAASSKTYADEIVGTARSHGLAVTELATHLQGQLVAVHPAYDEAFDAFAPKAVHGKPKERQDGRWSRCCWPPKPQKTWVSRPARRLPGRSPFPISTLGRNARRG